MKQLIVNADDFGLTQGVNQGILDTHHFGIVTSTSLMATGEAFEKAIVMSSQAPRLSIGVHLVLTQGIPLSPTSEVQTLVDARGRLFATPGRLFRGLLIHRVSLREVENELRRQVSRVFEMGITPTHLDGHQHVHVLPGISEIAVRLAREFGIPSVRCPAEESPIVRGIPYCLRGVEINLFRRRWVGRTVTWFARRFKSRLDQAGLKSPAHFYGLRQTGFLTGQRLEAILRNVPEGVSELMCHPGYTDFHLATTRTHLLAQREVETDVLTSPQTRKVTMDNGIHLISYREFAGKVLDDQ